MITKMNKLAAGVFFVLLSVSSLWMVVAQSSPSSVDHGTPTSLTSYGVLMLAGERTVTFDTSTVGIEITSTHGPFFVDKLYLTLQNGDWIADPVEVDLLGFVQVDNGVLIGFESRCKVVIPARKNLQLHSGDVVAAVPRNTLKVYDSIGKFTDYAVVAEGFLRFLIATQKCAAGVPANTNFAVVATVTAPTDAAVTLDIILYE